MTFIGVVAHLFGIVVFKLSQIFVFFLEKGDINSSYRDIRG